MLGFFVKSVQKVSKIRQKSWFSGNGNALRAVMVSPSFFQPEPLCVVVEFVPGGSLDTILHGSRIYAETNRTSYVNIWSRLTERELLRMARDVSNGMRYLESKQVSDDAFMSFVKPAGLFAIRTAILMITTTLRTLKNIQLSQRTYRNNYIALGDFV